MDFLLVLLLIVALISIVVIVSPKPGEVKSSTDDQIVVKRKQCPPHQWFWQEIIDQNGMKHGERIVCKVCGPLKSGGNDEV